MRTVLVSTLIAAFCLVSTAPAFADAPRFSSGYGKHYGKGKFYNGARFGYKAGYRDGFKYRSSFGRGYYDRGYYDRGYYDHRYRHKRGNSGDVALGIGIGILGLAVLGAASANRSERVVRADPEVVFVPQGNSSWSTPAPAAALDNGLDYSSCQVVREYTTTVEIGGKRVEAFGDACLQADGSWRMGPVKGTMQ